MMPWYKELVSSPKHYTVHINFHSAPVDMRETNATPAAKDKKTDCKNDQWMTVKKVWDKEWWSTVKTSGWQWLMFKKIDKGQWKEAMARNSRKMRTWSDLFTSKYKWSFQQHPPDNAVHSHITLIDLKCAYDIHIYLFGLLKL